MIDTLSYTFQNAMGQALSWTGSLPLAGTWFRDSASITTEQVDWVFDAILWICVFFFVLVVGLMVAFVARYYARPGREPEHTAHHNNLLEAAWSIFPGMIVIWIFWAGFTGYLNLRTAPEGAYEIQVIAKKWNWTFVYPNGYSDSDLHVPIDRPVKLIMTSDDVLHSLFVPAFRVKMDCVPGRYSTLWFQANRLAPSDDGDEINLEDEGGFDLFCTEYCGQGHSAMLAKVIVHESGTFESWLEKAMVWDETESPVERGMTVYKKRGCAQCHSLDGSKGTGPSFKGTYGTQQMTSTGEITVDENYIRESILNPNAKIRDGYKGVMPSYQGQIKENEIAALIWFHKSLNDVAVPATWTEAGGVPGQEAQADSEEADEEETTNGEAPAEQATEEAAPAEEAAEAAPAESDA